MDERARRCHLRGLLLGDIGGVERAWPAAWDDALACKGWERWLITGRLASVRADAELEARPPRRRGDVGTTIARDGPVGEASQVRDRVADHAWAGALGTGEHEAAAEELRDAVRLADGPGGSPLLRWRARAALGAAARQRAETAAEGEAQLATAASIIREIAGALAAERADRYLAAPQVARVLDAAG